MKFKTHKHIAWYLIGILLIGLAAWLIAKTEKHFAMSVFIHGAAGREVIPLRQQGLLWVNLGAEKRGIALNGNGEARINDIPASLLNKKALVSLDASGYELIEPKPLITLSNEAVYLAVRMRMLPLSGQVKDTLGNVVTGAMVRVGEYSVQTDENGWFMLNVPRNLPEKDQQMSVAIAGYQAYQIPITLDEHPLSLILQPAK